MDIQYYGANSIKITTKKSVIVTDPKSDIVDHKADLKKATAVAVTQDVYLPTVGEDVFVMQSPGEYEFEDYSVKGIAAQPHTATTGDMSATMYRFVSADTSLLVTGHIAPKLSEEQLEQIGMVDILVIPVGGGGYTLDAVEAAGIVRAIEPKLVIPVHYNIKGMSYSVPQADLELFTKELGAPVVEGAPDKLKVKLLPEQLSVQQLTVS